MDNIMTELNLEEIDKKYHWALYLPEYKNHPLQEVIYDFEPDTRSFFLSSYIYIGELKNKIVTIIHYHSSLKGPMKFMNMQNLNSYLEMKELTNKEMYYISMDITKDTVISLGPSDSLTPWHLDKIYWSSNFYVTDETGFVKSYNMEDYWG